MVVRLQDSASTDRVFAALSDATRRDILTRVLHEEASVSTLARRYDMSFAAVQKHVAVLERADLLTKQRRGREQVVRGDIDTVRAALQLLDHFEEIWRGRISRIDQLLTEPDPDPDPRSQPDPKED